MNNGFNENYQWITLLGVTGIYGYYFLKVLPPGGPDVTAEQIVFFTVLLVLLVVVYIVGAILCVAIDRFKDPKEDERDKFVRLKGRRNASYVLTLGTFAAMACAFFTEGNFWVVHALLGSLVVSQLAESATQVFYYRRGF